MFTDQELQRNKKNTNNNLRFLIENQLNPKNPIPLNRYELQNYAYYGIIDSSLRPELWKVLLFHYSPNKFKTEVFMQEKQASYLEYCKFADEKVSRDPEIMLVIEDDMNRTTLFPILNGTKTECRFLDKTVIVEGNETTHRQIIKKILTTFKVTNPAIEYVQGMNMLILIIYYVFSTSSNTTFIESDVFYCFLALVSEVGDYFVENMDDKYSGISQKLDRVIDIVKLFDPELYKNMESKKLTDNIFHFRWVFLSFAQEFPIDEVVWLWDRLLSDNTRFEMVLYCAAAKILLLKKKILVSDFGSCMQLFQNNEDVDVHSMFYKADEMRRIIYKDESE